MPGTVQRLLQQRGGFAETAKLDWRASRRARNRGYIFGPVIISDDDAPMLSVPYLEVRHRVLPERHLLDCNASRMPILLEALEVRGRKFPVRQLVDHRIDVICAPVL